MKRTRITQVTATLWMLVVTISLIFLVACSAPATPTAVTDLITLTSPQEITSTHIPETPNLTPNLATSTPPPLASLPEPVPAETILATASVANSPLPSPTPGGMSVSPLPSPTWAPTPPAVEVMFGEPAPDFTLQDAQGEAVTLSDYQGSLNVVLVFYRGQT